MRISIVGPVYPYRGGIAQHTALLARHLAERHDVQVISFTRQYPRWLLHGRSDRDPSRQPSQPGAAYLLDPLNPITWWRVARRVRAWASDLLILPWWVPFWAPAWYCLARLAHRAGSARVLFLCHNVLPHESSPVDRWLARHVLAQGDALLAQSAEGAALLRELAPGRPVTWTPHPSYAELCAAGPAISDRAAAKANLGLGPGPLALFFGFVRPYKGLAVLLDALALVRSQVRDVHLLVVGEIWEGKEAYLAQIGRLDLAGHVTVVDAYVPDERLAEYFGAADVVVLPYLTATQSGVVALAGGFGVPVIATRVGGLPDAVSDGRTGMLVPPGDPAALAQAIARFFQANLGPMLAENMRQDESRFGWQHMVTTIESLAASLPGVTAPLPLQEQACPKP